MGSHYYFVLAAFVVSAALLKAGVPAIPIALGIGIAGLVNMIWSKRRQKERRRALTSARK